MKTHKHASVRDDGDTEIEVEFTYLPGEEPSGLSGPPEDYDPGSGPEIEIVKAWTLDTSTTVVLTDAEEERVKDEIRDDPPLADEREWVDF